MSKLEDSFVKYQDLINIPSKDNKEPLVELSQIPFSYIQGMRAMEKIAGKKILVRERVLKKLIAAQSFLQTKNPDLSLFVTFGYRDITIQTKRFLKRLQQVAEEKFYENPTDLYEAVHPSIAVPTVAGHPTGGAIDITIINIKTGRFLDFGSKQYDYSNIKYYVFSPNISQKARANRMLLRKCMMNAGFAPFDGEWWHFSFGDKEWAFYYKKPYAIYSQKLLLSKEKIT